ncbi:hypothetical protein I4U23_020714 [Adineta vaga]|nr:hypothetical protein I4U23_020714 [Adineta vaga]
MHGVILEANINSGNEDVYMVKLYIIVLFNVRRILQKSERLMSTISLVTDNPLITVLPAYIRFSLKANLTSIFSFANGGFYGISIKIGL